MFERHRLYHLPAAHIRWDAVEPVLFTIQHANARGTINLMATEGKEVTVEVLHIHTEVRRTLRTIYQHGHAMFVGNANNFLDGIYRTQHIADMGDADNSGVFVEVCLNVIETNATFVVDGQDTDFYTLTSLKQLPGDDVRVVFHLGDEHLVTFLHKSLTEARCHKVDALRSATGKDDFTCTAGIQEPTYRFACLFVQVGRLLGKEMHTTMYVSIHVVVLLCHGLYHLPRLLRRSCVVEINEWVFLVYLTAENGEILSDFLYRAHRAHRTYRAYGAHRAHGAYRAHRTHRTHGANGTYRTHYTYELLT